MVLHITCWKCVDATPIATVKTFDSYCEKKRRFGLDLPYTHKNQSHSLIPFTSSGLDSHSNYKVELCYCYRHFTLKMVP